MGQFAVWRKRKAHLLPVEAGGGISKCSVEFSRVGEDLAVVEDLLNSPLARVIIMMVHQHLEPNLHVHPTSHSGSGVEISINLCDGIR